MSRCTCSCHNIPGNQPIFQKRKRKINFFPSTTFRGAYLFLLLLFNFIFIPRYLKDKIYEKDNWKKVQHITVQRFLLQCVRTYSVGSGSLITNYTSLTAGCFTFNHLHYSRMHWFRRIISWFWFWNHSIISHTQVTLVTSNKIKHQIST